MRRLTTPGEVEEAFRAPRTLVYKHSPRCGTSVFTLREVEAFAANSRQTPVVWIDVVRDRPLSKLFAERSRVRHESPQVILLENGVPVWHASHGEITEELLEERVLPRT